MSNTTKIIPYLFTYGASGDNKEFYIEYKDGRFTAGGDVKLSDMASKLFFDDVLRELNKLGHFIPNQPNNE